MMDKAIKNRKEIEAYQKFVNKINQATKRGSTNEDNQNRQTISNNTFIYTEKISQNQYNPNYNQQNDNYQNQRKIFEKMNQKLMNQRRNADWDQNQNYNNDINNNGKNNIDRNEIDRYKVYTDHNNVFPLGQGKNAPIVKILNERNNELYSQYQNKNSNKQNNFNFSFNPDYYEINEVEQNYKNNNINYPFKSNIDNTNNEPQNNIKITFKEMNQNKINRNYNNNFSNNVPEISITSQNHYPHFNNNLNNNSNNNANESLIQLRQSEEGSSNDPKRGNKVCSSILYGIIFGSFGTLLLWCKKPEVREYLKSCYQNVNTESIANIFKSFLHPIELAKSLGNNMSSFREILKESINYIYNFIEEYSDMWRLLGIIVMVYALWLIIKKILKKFKNSNKKKNVKEDGQYNIA